MSNLLLIISCSSSKRKDIGKIPAIDRYNGPYYKSLRILLNKNCIPKNLDIKIISAKYGLIDQKFPIEYYDQKMDKERAKELNSEILVKLKQLFNKREYSQIYVNLGNDYRPAIDGIEKLTSIQPIYAPGTIGIKLNHMITWIKNQN